MIDLRGRGAGKSRAQMLMLRAEARRRGKVTRALLVGARSERELVLGANGEDVIDVEVLPAPLAPRRTS